VITKDAANAIVTSDHLAYDNGSRITGDEIINGLSGGRTYGNDGLDRLTSATTSAFGNGLFAAVQPVTYNYDVVGNRTSVVNGGATTTYTVAAAPRWNEYSSVNATAFTYDTRHNLTGDGVRTMTYDADNRLVEATKSGTTVDFTYDWQHHITQKWVGGTLNRRYVYDGWHVIADHRRGGDARGRQRRTLPAGRDEREARASQYDGAGGLVRKYIVGSKTDEVLAQKTGGGITHYFCRDHLGSTMAVIAAASNTVTQRYTYDAYGNVTLRDAAGNPALPGAILWTNYLYTGREWQSEIGLYNYRNRFYHPEIGRFLQPDPIGFGGADVNWYAYVGNATTRSTDPFGTMDARTLVRILFVWFCAGTGLSNPQPGLRNPLPPGTSPSERARTEERMRRPPAAPGAGRGGGSGPGNGGDGPDPEPDPDGPRLPMVPSPPSPPSVQDCADCMAVMTMALATTALLSLIATLAGA
jgi:RHS repeat-associated protein